MKSLETVEDYAIDREERNICAILYHLLQVNGNLQTFFKHLNVEGYDEQNYSMFFEYSYLRDIWSEFKDNEVKKSYILTELGYPKDHFIHNTSCSDFNAYFGASRKPSNKFIQSPSNWAILRYDANIKDNKEFLNISRFKWCFNAKPDMVFHFGQDKAICIEANLNQELGCILAVQLTKKYLEKEVFHMKSKLKLKLIFLNY